MGFKASGLARLPLGVVDKPKKLIVVRQFTHRLQVYYEGFDIFKSHSLVESTYVESVDKPANVGQWCLLRQLH